MRLKTTTQLLLTALAFVLSLNALGQDRPPAEIARTILAFYDPKVHKDIYFTNIHQSAEVVLNHLGLKVRYRSILEPLPDQNQMKNVRGILTWFTNPDAVPDPNTYCHWLKKQMEGGIKLAILGHFGVLKEKNAGLSPACQAMFNTLGGRYGAEYFENPYFLKVVTLDPSMVAFERKLSLTEGLTYALIKPTGRPDTHVYLEIARTDLGDSASSLVFTTDRGGYAHTSFVIYENHEIDRRQWRLNPFAFFAEAYDVTHLPKIDTTTINGKRIFYSHIDGDGIFNISNIDKRSFSGEIIYENIIKKYRGVPITASLITGYFDLKRFHTERTKQLYRKIFSLSHVAPASHSYAHPLKWSKKTLALDIPGYEFDAQTEILGSVIMMRKLLATLRIPKPTTLFLWTGDCLPDASEIRNASRFDLLNMNGGDSRFDRRYNSYSYLFPLGILRKGLLQVYSSGANENVYTNLWQGPYYGYRLVTETFQNTETPIRIKPINVYYHFYSGEHQASLTALKKVYDFALAQDIFPIVAGTYPKIVSDFFDAKIYKISNGYKFIHHGWVRTVRYDHTTKNVDIARSKGVLGFNHYQDSLYVFLNEGTEHEIVLTEKQPATPYVISASFEIKDFKGCQDQVTFRKKGWYRSQLTLGGLRKNRTYLVKTDGESIQSRTNDQGILDVAFSSAENDGPFRQTRISLVPD